MVARSRFPLGRPCLHLLALTFSLRRLPPELCMPFLHSWSSLRGSVCSLSGVVWTSPCFCQCTQLLRRGWHCWNPVSWVPWLLPRRQALSCTPPPLGTLPTSFRCPLALLPFSAAFRRASRTLCGLYADSMWTLCFVRLRRSHGRPRFASSSIVFWGHSGDCCAGKHGV